MAAALRRCEDVTPAGFSGHWREWHRGHGCHLDDGKGSDKAMTPTPPAQPPLTRMQQLTAKERAYRTARECRSWGVDESKVDYDLPLGDAWCITHLLDIIHQLEAQLSAVEAERDALLAEVEGLREQMDDARAICRDIQDDLARDKAKL